MYVWSLELNVYCLLSKNSYMLFISLFKHGNLNKKNLPDIDWPFSIQQVQTHPMNICLQSLVVCDQSHNVHMRSCIICNNVIISGRLQQVSTLRVNIYGTGLVRLNAKGLNKRFDLNFHVTKYNGDLRNNREYSNWNIVFVMRMILFCYSVAISRANVQMNSILHLLLSWHLQLGLVMISRGGGITLISSVFHL